MRFCCYLSACTDCRVILDFFGLIIPIIGMRRDFGYGRGFAWAYGHLWVFYRYRAEILRVRLPDQLICKLFDEISQ